MVRSSARSTTGDGDHHCGGDLHGGYLHGGDLQGGNLHGGGDLPRGNLHGGDGFDNPTEMPMRASGSATIMARSSAGSTTGDGDHHGGS